MVRNNKIYKLLLLIILVILITGTQTLAVTISRVSNLEVSNVQKTKATLSWDRVSNATGYEIWINVPGNGYANIGRTTSTSRTLSGFTEGTTYKAKIRAYRTISGKTTYGSYSNEITFTTTGSSSTTVGKVSNLKASNVQQTRATLSWDRVSNATGYEIWINVPGNGYVNLGKTTGRNVSIPELTEGTTYKAKVRAYRTVSGKTTYGSYSNEITFTTTASTSTTVGKVSNLRASNVQQTRATLSWDRVSNATGYEIWINIPGNGYVNLGKTTGRNVSIPELTAGTTYKAKVRAYRTISGKTTYGSYSNEITFTTTGSSSTTVGKVSNLRASSVQEASVTLNWNKVSNATGYEIWVNIPQRGYVNLGKITSVRVSVTGLTLGTTYSIKVRAYKTVNGTTTYGEYSNEITFTTSSTTLGEVSNLKASNIKETRASLSWDRVSNATGYEIWVNIPGRGYINIGKITSTNVSISGLIRGTTYSVKVRAYRTENGKTTYADEYSNEVTFTTPN